MTSLNQNFHPLSTRKNKEGPAEPISCPPATVVTTTTGDEPKLPVITHEVNANWLNQQSIDNSWNVPVPLEVNSPILNTIESPDSNPTQPSKLGNLVDIVTQTLDEHFGANTPPPTDRPSPEYSLPYYLGTDFMGHTQPFLTLPPVEDNQRSDYDPYLDLIKATTTALLTNLGIDLSYGGNLNIGLGTRMGAQALVNHIKTTIHDITQQKYVFELCGVSLALLASHGSHLPTQFEIAETLNQWRQTVSIEFQNEWEPPAQNHHQPQLPSLAASKTPETIPDSAEALFATLSPANVQLLERLGQGHPLTPAEIGILAILAPMQKLVERLLKLRNGKAPQEENPKPDLINLSPELTSTKPTLTSHQLSEELLDFIEELVGVIESKQPDVANEWKEAIILNLRGKIGQLKKELQLPLGLHIEAVFKGEQFLGLAATDASHTSAVNLSDPVLQSAIDTYLAPIAETYWDYLAHLPQVDPLVQPEQYQHDYKERLSFQIKLTTLLENPQLLQMAASYSSGVVRLITDQQNIILGKGMQFFPRATIQEPQLDLLGVTAFEKLKAVLAAPHTIEHLLVYSAPIAKRHPSAFAIGLTALACTLAVVLGGCASSTEANQNPRPIEDEVPTQPIPLEDAPENVLPLSSAPPLPTATTAPSPSNTLESVSASDTWVRDRLAAKVLQLQAQLHSVGGMVRNPNIDADESAKRIQVVSTGITQLSPEHLSHYYANQERFETELAGMIIAPSFEENQEDITAILALAIIMEQNSPQSGKYTLGLDQWLQVRNYYQLQNPNQPWPAEAVIAEMEIQGTMLFNTLKARDMLQPQYFDSLNGQIPIMVIPVPQLQLVERVAGLWEDKTGASLASVELESSKNLKDLTLTTFHEISHGHIPNKDNKISWLFRLALGKDLQDSGLGVSEADWQALQPLRSSLRLYYQLDHRSDGDPIPGILNISCEKQVWTCLFEGDTQIFWDRSDGDARQLLLTQLAEQSARFSDHALINPIQSLFAYGSQNPGEEPNLNQQQWFEIYLIIARHPDFADWLNPNWDGTWPEEHTNDGTAQIPVGGMIFTVLSGVGKRRRREEQAPLDDARASIWLGMQKAALTPQEAYVIGQFYGIGSDGAPIKPNSNLHNIWSTWNPGQGGTVPGPYTIIDVLTSALAKITQATLELTVESPLDHAGTRLQPHPDAGKSDYGQLLSGKQIIELTPSEYLLMRLFMVHTQSDNGTFSLEQISHALYGVPHIPGFTGGIKALISKLRPKLDDSPFRLEAIESTGSYRFKTCETQGYQLAGYVFNEAKNQVTKPGSSQPITLLPIDYRIFYRLANAANHPVDPSDIAASAWFRDLDPDTVINRVRERMKKIKQLGLGDNIVTVSSIGYMLTNPDLLTPALQSSPFQVFPQEHIAYVTKPEGVKIVAFTPYQFAVFNELYNRPDAPCSVELLCGSTPEPITQQNLEGIISQLRKKLGDDRIEIVRGMGYRLHTQLEQGETNDSFDTQIDTTNPHTIEKLQTLHPELIEVLRGKVLLDYAGVTKITNKSEQEFGKLLLDKGLAVVYEPNANGSVPDFYVFNKRQKRGNYAGTILEICLAEKERGEKLENKRKQQTNLEAMQMKHTFLYREELNRINQANPEYMLVPKTSFDSLNCGPIPIETLEAMDRVFAWIWKAVKSGTRTGLDQLLDRSYWESVGVTSVPSPASPGYSIPRPRISQQLEDDLTVIREQIAAEIEAGKPEGQMIRELAAKYGYASILQFVRNQGGTIAAYLGGAVGASQGIPLDNQTLFWAMLGSYLMYIPTLYAANQKADRDSFRKTDSTSSIITTWWHDYLKKRGFDPFSETANTRLENLVLAAKEFVVSAPGSTIEVLWGEAVVVGPALLYFAAPYISEEIAQVLGLSKSEAGLSNELMQFILPANLAAAGFYYFWPRIQRKLMKGTSILEIKKAMKDGDWNKIDELLRDFAKAVAQDAELLTAIYGQQLPGVLDKML